MIRLFVHFVAIVFFVVSPIFALVDGDADAVWLAVAFPIGVLLARLSLAMEGRL